MKKQIVVVASLLTLLACTPGMKTTSSWTNKEVVAAAKDKGYKTIFISVITSKLELRTKMEASLAEAAEKRGYVAIKSIDKFPPITNDKPSKDVILSIIRKTGADAIFTTAVVDKQAETRYVPGTTYAPYPGFGYYGSFYGYYGNAWGYSSPGYYTTDKTYFLESNLYDAATETIIWSVQSKVYNPTSIEKSAKQYTALMIEQLEADGLLKKGGK
jgi:hypothetical protein